MSPGTIALLALALLLSLAWWFLASRSLRSAWTRLLLLAMVLAQGLLLVDFALSLAPSPEGLHTPETGPRVLLRLASVAWHALCVPLGLLFLAIARLRPPAKPKAPAVLPSRP